MTFRSFYIFACKPNVFSKNLRDDYLCPGLCFIKILYMKIILMIWINYFNRRKTKPKIFLGKDSKYDFKIEFFLCITKNPNNLTAPPLFLFSSFLPFSLFLFVSFSFSPYPYRDLLLLPPLTRLSPFPPLFCLLPSTNHHFNHKKIFTIVFFPSNHQRCELYSQRK